MTGDAGIAELHNSADVKPLWRLIPTLAGENYEKISYIFSISFSGLMHRM